MLRDADYSRDYCTPAARGHEIDTYEPWTHQSWDGREQGVAVCNSGGWAGTLGPGRGVPQQPTPTPLNYMGSWWGQRWVDDPLWGQAGRWGAR